MPRVKTKSTSAKGATAITKRKVSHLGSPYPEPKPPATGMKTKLQHPSDHESEPESEPMELDPNSPKSPILNSPRTPKSPKILRNIPPGKGYKKYKEEGLGVMENVNLQELEKMLSKQFPTVSTLITPKDWPQDIYPISTLGFYPISTKDKHKVKIIKYLGGEGTQGAVFLVEIRHYSLFHTYRESTAERNLHALKVSRTTRETFSRIPPNELRVLSNLSVYHPRITPLKAFRTEGDFDFLYFPYADAGDLSTFIEMYKIKKLIIPEAFIWHIMTQLIEAVYFLQFPERLKKSYDYSIWHLDIKPENVLMQWPPANKDNTDYYPNIQLGGFGFAIEVRKSLLRTSGAAAQGPLGLKLSGFTGTIPYAAPEQLKGYYNSKTDVWGIGATIHECIHGYPPITPQRTHYTRARSTGTHTVYNRPIYSDLEWRGMPGTPRACWEMPGHYSAMLRETLYHMLREDPSPKSRKDDLTKRSDIEDLKGLEAYWGEQIKINSFVGLPEWFLEDREGNLGDRVRREREGKIILGQDGLAEWRVDNMWRMKVQGWEY